MWQFVKTTKNEYMGTYAVSVVKPRSLLSSPFVSMDDVSKLATITKTGACLDFALGITEILSDLGCTAHVVEIRGANPAIPEVMIGDRWYVIDALFTTPDYPNETHQWAKYLARSRYEIISKL